jgi:cyclic-di-GMP phosphodiesterase TipF (flagellum assembly factor)
MKQAKAAVAAEDFKDLLFRNGLNLIVERVENEKTVVQLLEYNIDFGQGFLFGAPKPIREVSEMADPRGTPPSNAAVLPAASRRLAS